MATVKLQFNKSRVSHDGLFPLVFQVIHQRKKKLVYVGERISEKQFDVKKRKVIHHPDSPITHYRVGKLNQTIKDMDRRLHAVINLFESRSVPYTVEQLMGQFALDHENQKDLYLFTYFDQRIRFKKELGKVGIMAAYQSTRTSLERYWGNVDVRLSEVTHHFVKGYLEFLQMTRVSSNTIAYYMRNFRTIYKYALKENDGLPIESDPFKGVLTQPAKTVKRALTREMLVEIAKADFSIRPAVDQARDLFLFSFYTRGMSFVDIIYLTKQHISEGVLTYQRAKTGQTLSIRITDQLNALIEKYAGHSPYIFPWMKEGEPEEQYRLYRSSLRRINNSLKSLAKALGSDQALASYVARHSWATQARDCGAPIAVISEGLGHTSEKTTAIYLKQLDRNVLDQINDTVTSLK